MYLEFYGLKEKPFSHTPDPIFFYQSKAHGEAVAFLKHGLGERKGFLQFTGPVGSGKTTVMRTVLSQINRKAEVAYIFNPRAPFPELLRSIMKSLNIPNIPQTRLKMDLLVFLHDYLILQHRKSNMVIVIFDEAQSLSIKNLEEIRMLSNFETTKEKLIQIVFTGQPEFVKTLDHPELIQLKQRIQLRYHLSPLSLSEVKEYINHRLIIAGFEGTSLFTDDAFSEIFNFSEGIPRLINSLCDMVLLNGYADGRKLFDSAAVKVALQAVAGYSDDESAARPEGESLSVTGDASEPPHSGETELPDDSLSYSETESSAHTGAELRDKENLEKDDQPKTESRALPVDRTKISGKAVRDAGVLASHQAMERKSRYVVRILLIVLVMTGLAAGAIMLYQFEKRHSTDRVAAKQSTVELGAPEQESHAEAIEEPQKAEDVVAEGKPEGTQGAEEVVEEKTAELDLLAEEKEEQLELERQILINEEKALLTKTVLEAELAARKVQAARESAIVAMRAMEKSRADAEGDDAQLHAQSLWRTGEQERQEGKELFDLLEYASAKESFEKTQELYVQARKETETKLEQLARQERARERRKAEADLLKKGLETTKAKADKEQAAQYAKENYDLAEQKLQEGNDKYQAQDFLAAAKLYEEAAYSFQESAEEAELAKALPASTALRDGKVISIKDGAEMIKIPAGEFIMGASDEGGESGEHPPHRVKIDAFYMDRYEVTNAQFCKFLNEREFIEGNRNVFLEIDNEDCLIMRKDDRFISKPGYADHPAINLNWLGANAYAAWADKRLPTEAEWEYACRAGTTTQYNFGGTMSHGDTNYAGTGGSDMWEKTAPVGSFAPNKWGLFDMHGNVLEWCSDWYDEEYYENSPGHNPTGPPTGRRRVVRGVSWSHDTLAEMRSTYRSYRPPKESASNLGFRCVSDLE